jgi:steroid delta-isomerase-like uncharacterized protein
MVAMMISVSNRYFQALSALDRDAYLSCFSAEASLNDPYGGRPFTGQKGLSTWFTGMERTWSEFSMEPNAEFISGNRIAVHWQAAGSATSGKTAAFSGINVFTVNESGLITQLEGYWDLQSMLAQIS